MKDACAKLNVSESGSQNWPRLGIHGSGSMPCKKNSHLVNMTNVWQKIRNPIPLMSINTKYGPYQSKLDAIVLLFFSKID